MKIVYYIVIPILAIIILWFSYLLWVATPVSIDKKLIETNSRLLGEKNFILTNEIGDRVKNVVLSPVLWEKNLFDPSRGVVAKSNVVVSGELNVEVLGIYTYNDVCGAVIVSKRGGVGGGVSGSYGGGYRPSGQAGQAEEKVFFKVGEVLDNGYTLSSVGRDYVELTGAGNTVKVPLKFGSDDSNKRIASSAKSDVKRQITIISSSSTKGEAGSSSQSSSGVTVIQSQRQGPSGATYGNQR